MGSGGIPVGSYNAEFMGEEPYTENTDKYGEGVSLKWKVIGGEQDGEEAGRICSKKFSPKSNLAKFAAMLKGSKIERGEPFKFDDFVGARGSIIIEETDSGSTRVGTFLRAN